MCQDKKRKEILKLINCRTDDEYFESLRKLKSIASPNDDIQLQNIYIRFAKKAAGLDFNLKKIKICFMSNSTLDHWIDSLRFWLLLEGIQLDAKIVPIGTWRQQIINHKSILYEFNPQYVWLFLVPNDYGIDLNLVSTRDIDSTKIINEAIYDINHHIDIVKEKINSTVIVNNLVPSYERVLGNFEGSIYNSRSTIINQFNLDLMSGVSKGTIIFDIAYIASKVGLRNWENPKLKHYSKHPFSLEVNGEVAFAASRLLGATIGTSKKCIVLDLDNTLWGGIVGDDGVDGILIGPNGGNVGEAFQSFQLWLKAMVSRGIALAVCSKNDEKLAKEPFYKRKDMVLQLDDFVSFKANWNNKADNIRAIAKEINLSLDSFIFVDDNPAERALVMEELSDVVVPSLPEDPAEYVRTITDGLWFETISISNEDHFRVETYRQNAARNKIRSKATDMDSFLRNLEMHSTWGVVNNHTLKRVVQLINKTNQFNLTNKRYTENEINKIISDSGYCIIQFSLSDRFGDYGIISVVILKLEKDRVLIDTWVMSCRVFSRTMEHFIFNSIYKIAVQKGFNTIIGKYSESKKNMYVADLFEKFGGVNHISKSNEKQWIFNLDTKKINTKTYIKNNNK